MHRLGQDIRHQGVSGSRSLGGGFVLLSAGSKQKARTERACGGAKFRFIPLFLEYQSGRDLLPIPADYKTMGIIGLGGVP